MKPSEQKGFTLIELLIVIAIIAVLAVVVVLTLNPAELLKQARDSNRVSDLSTLKSAVSLYLADGQSTTSAPWNTGNCYVDNALANCSGRFDSIGTAQASSSRTVDGTGWIPISFTSISSGSPIGQLPVDPTRNANLYYAFKASSTTGYFEINADMESARYSSTGSGNVESNDGGDVSTLFEVGTNLTDL